MKYILFILLFFLCLSCSHRPVQEVDTVSYRGWENCLKLSNRAVSVIVNPTYGGQILYFGLESRGDNILWSDSVINGWTVENYIRTRRSPDAGRFDIGNERRTENIHDSIWQDLIKPLLRKINCAWSAIPHRRWVFRWSGFTFWKRTSRFCILNSECLIFQMGRLNIVSGHVHYCLPVGFTIVKRCQIHNIHWDLVRFHCQQIH